MEANFTDAQIDQLMAEMEQRMQGGGAFSKAFLQTGDLVWYDLQPRVRLLYPYEILIPLIRELPRVEAEGGIQTNWKQITDIDTAGMAGGISEGNRGGILNVKTASLNAPYSALGFEQAVSFEARYAGKNLDDIVGIAVQSTLRRLRVYEEQALLWGNRTLALGQTGTPTVAAVSNGGTLGSITLSVICVALTAEGSQGFKVSVANGIKGLVSRVNADTSQDSFGGGSAIKSAASAGTPVTQGATAVVTALKGAMAYAWFWGLAGAEVLGAITPINSVTISAAAAGTQTAASLPSADNSINALVPDGIITQMLASTFGVASGSIVTTMPNGVAGVGTPMTSDGSFGIVEWDTILQTAYTNYKLGYDKIIVNAQQSKDFSNKVLNNVGGAGLARIVIESDASGKIVAGQRVGSYHNKFMGNDLPVETHPFCPDGTVIFWSTKVPYALSQVENLLEARYRQNYYEIDWPITSRKYQVGAYVDETFANYFTGAFGMLTNVAHG